MGGTDGLRARRRAWGRTVRTCPEGLAPHTVISGMAIIPPSPRIERWHPKSDSAVKLGKIVGTSGGGAALSFHATLLYTVPGPPAYRGLTATRTREVG